jgi:putative ABC transport system permease protein
MFFKFVYRIWKKNSTSFILRVLGLTISLSFIFVLLVFILHEKSYDDHIPNKENIYRITTYSRAFDQTIAETPFYPRSLILNNVPEIAGVAGFNRLPDIFIQRGNNYIFEKNIVCADFELFKSLGIKLLQGDFSDPDFIYYIALSSKTAEKYFPGGNAVGSLLTLNQAGKELSVMVSAVFENIPENSTFKADIIGNFQILFYFKGINFEKEPLKNILNYCFFSTYITLEKNCNPHLIEEKMNRLLYPPEKEPDNVVRLQPIKNIYLESNELINNDLPAGSNLNIRLFIIICVLLVFIGSANLALITATFHYHRKQEYYVRTIHGASKIKIFARILGEIFLVIVLSFGLSVLLSTFLKQFINVTFGKDLNLDHRSFIKLIFLFEVILIFILLTTTVLTGVFIYGKNTGRPIQDKSLSLFSYFRWNKLLVLGQISAFSALIVISTLFANQWKFIKSQDALGFNPENILVLDLPSQLNKNCTSLMNDLALNPNILDIAESDYIPMLGPICNREIYLGLNDDYSKTSSIVSINIGSHFFKTLDLKLVQGREFDLSGKFDRDNSIMLNESAVKSLQLEDPLGKKVAFKEIIGIVKDFPIESLYEKISPLFIFPKDNYTNYLIIKYRGDRSKVFDVIAEKQMELARVSEVKLSDFTGIISDTYQHEKKLKSIFILFTIIAVILGIFGIIGLLIFTLQKRSKEITVRIIHGASYFNIVSLISREFLITVIISNIITYPFIWYFANDWLNNFTNHININVLYFLFGTGTTILIVLVIVSLIVLSHIRHNPVRNFNR